MTIANPTQALLKTVGEDSINGVPVRLTDQNGNIISTSVRSIVVPSAAYTVSGNSAAQSPGPYRELLAFLRLTAVGGTFTAGQGLTCFIDISDDGGTTWYQLAQIGTSNQQAVPSAPYQGFIQTVGLGTSQGGWGDTYRIRWVISGTTPSFTFQVATIVK